MWPQLYEWIALFIKWFHVIAGIAWIGASFYFTWLDYSLREPPGWKKEKGIRGDLWAVHGGGFYEIAKYHAAPRHLPKKLHWFRWEAYTTWITGTALLIWMYYFKASAYLIDPRIAELTPLQAVGIGAGGILAGVLVYEIILRSPLARNRWLFLLSTILISGGFFFYFTNFFSGRAAFIHMGALIGSVMVCNVWLKIIPGQKKMVAQMKAETEVDPTPGLEGKRRSVHNNYLTLPVLFLMLSNHYPMIYQHELNWLIGLVVSVLSAWIRHYFNLRHQGKSRPMVLITGTAGLLIFALLASIPHENSTPPLKGQAPHLKGQAPVTSEAIQGQAPDSEQITVGKNLTQLQARARQVIEVRCTSCHSRTPTDEVFTVAPSGVVLDEWEDIERWTMQILYRTVETEDMPFQNKTQMTREERALIDLALSESGTPD